MRVLIRADGTTQEFGDPQPMEYLHKLLGAETFDVVNLRHLGPPLQVMLVDDHGYSTEVVETPSAIEIRPIRALKPFNEEATRLYLLNCRPGTTHKIVGDVYVCPDDDFT